MIAPQNWEGTPEELLDRINKWAGKNGDDDGDDDSGSTSTSEPDEDNVEDADGAQ